MKKHQTTWGGLLAVLTAMATGVTFGAENFPVARGTIVFHVVDERGEAVEGATCSAWFIKNDSLFSQKEVRARTDGEGNARLQGKTNGEVVFHVEKEGFWMTRGRYWMYRSPFAPVDANGKPDLSYGIDIWPAPGEEAGVSWGCWTPRERSVDVMLKKKHGNTPVKCKAFHSGQVAPLPAIGVDCQSGDWTPPCGRGTVADATIECRSGDDGVEVWLDFGENGGGMLFEKEHWSDWPYRHEAPETGYRNRIRIPLDTTSRWSWGIVGEMCDHYVVFRSREVECDPGNPVSAHYGMIAHLRCSIGTESSREPVVDSAPGREKPVSLLCINAIQCYFNEEPDNRLFEPELPKIRP